VFAQSTFSIEDAASLGAMAAVVAHPDDESIGCGALLARARRADVVVVTHGASSSPEFLKKVGAPTMDGHAARRWGELRDALASAEIDPALASCLNVEDGGVWRAAEAVVSSLASMFEERRLRLVLTHAFEGGHSDHDGVAYCVHRAALALGERAPTIVEMPFYNLGPSGPQFQTFCDGPEGTTIALEAREVALKRAMYAAYRSQERVLRRVSPEFERYRIVAPTAFCVAPNGGRLKYDRADPRYALPDWMRTGRLAA